MTTPTRITRPDLRVPDQIQITTSLDMLLFLETGLLSQLSTLEQEIAYHADCRLDEDAGCRVREEWLIAHYGSLAEAAEAGFVKGHCAGDLMYRYKAAGELLDFIAQAKHVRSSPTGRGLHERTDAEAKLAEVRGEVAHRVEAAREPTATFPIVVPRKPDPDGVKEEKPATADDTSLLGLTDDKATKKLTPAEARAKTK